MTEVILTDDDRVEYALKLFRRKVQRSGVLKELRQRRYYMKPSLAKRIKQASAKRRRARQRNK